MEDDVFSCFSPFIQDYIYRSGWESLRGVQTEAAKILFRTDHNLLLTSSTASGKTEAAFFPILSMMSEDPPRSFGVLYIAPLKSLINDQFGRLADILDLTGIPVFHWHGDVAMSHKNKALNHPQGILQITPESLESMLINRSNDIVRLFGDLRFVVLDEVHVLTGTDRGNQIMCQLARIQRLIGHAPRRIGLSATVGDVRKAAGWLGAGSGRETDSPIIPGGKITWRLGMEHFYIQSREEAAGVVLPADGEEAAGAAISSDGAHANPLTGSVPASLTAARNESAAESGSLSCTEGSSERTRGDTKGSPAFSGDDPDADPSAECEKSEAVPEEHAGLPDTFDPGFSYMYDCTRQKKCIIFANSREETEYICATLRQIAERRGDPDVFLIHHGNLSASIREEAELKLKDDSLKTVTCATVTLELGIDIGRLERIIQADAPNTVSSMLQRLGRSGRRGTPPEMMMVFREENPLPNTPLPQLIPWGLLRAIACVQLYIEDRFIEPPNVKKLPFSLLFQQTLSVLAASGELSPRRLAERLLTLPPFQSVPKEDYKTLLLSMLKNDFIEMTEEKGLIVGLKGERLLSSFKFYAVFKDSEDYTVRCQSDEIGTITSPPPVGDRFALAGRVWEVEELDIPRKLIYVRPVKGKMEISWPGDFGEIHTRILERMKQVLEEDTVYPYLKPGAAKRLETARQLARRTGMLRHSVVPLGGYTWCLFPWLGTRSFRTLRKYIARSCAPLRLSNLEFEGCYFMTFRMEHGTGRELIELLCDKAQREGIDPESLVSKTESPVFEKYDDYIPGELLRRAYAADRLRTDELLVRLPQLRAEFEED